MKRKTYPSRESDRIPHTTPGLAGNCGQSTNSADNLRTEQPAPDYGEPWKLHTDFAYDITVNGALAASFEELDKANRAISCVNACAGMVDPAAEIQEMREELADIRQRLKGHPDSKLDGESGFATRVSDEAREAAAIVPELVTALEACSLVLAGERLSKTFLVNALEKAQSALTKAKGQPLPNPLDDQAVKGDQP